MKIALSFYLGAVMLLIYNSILISNLQSYDFTISDFRAQYTGAVLFRRRMYNKLYDLKAQYEIQKEIFPKLIFDQLLPFFSPPLVAMILSPLALLSFKYAYLTFCILLIINLVFTSFLFFYKTKVSKKGEKIFGVKPIDTFLLLSLFFPFWLHILNAQLTLFWIQIFFLLYLLLENKRYIIAGLTLSLLSLKPHLLFVPMLFFIATRKWVVFFSAIVGITILFLTGLLFGGFEGLNNYLYLLVLMTLKGSGFGLNIPVQPTLKGLLFWLFERFLNPSTIVAVWVFLSFITILVCINYWSRVSKKKFDSKLNLFWSMVVTITLLTSPHTHYHDFGLFIIPLFLTIQFLLNDYITKLRYIKKAFWHSYIKYIGAPILILLSVGVAYFPPIALISYIGLVYFIVKQLRILVEKN